MRGSALETCSTKLVVAVGANRSTHVPLQIYLHQSDHVAEVMIENANMLKDMSSMVRRMKVVIIRPGFEFRYAQNKYHYIGEAPETRSKPNFLWI